MKFFFLWVLTFSTIRLRGVSLPVFKSIIRIAFSQYVSYKYVDCSDKKHISIQTIDIHISSAFWGYHLYCLWVIKLLLRVVPLQVRMLCFVRLPRLIFKKPSNRNLISDDLNNTNKNYKMYNCQQNRKNKYLDAFL